MKRIKKVGLMLALIMVMTMSATVVASAATVPPQNLQDLITEIGEEPAQTQEITTNGAVSILVQGYIIPLGNTNPPVNPDIPQTGDNSNMDLYAIIGLGSLLLLQCLLLKKEKRDELQTQEF